jgi:sulfatase modifying factor 1
MSCCLPVSWDPASWGGAAWVGEGGPCEVGSAMVQLRGGPFRMGTDDKDGYAEDGEGPSRCVTVSDFQMAPTPVTNREFREFVRATRYVTQAEALGSSFVFYLLVPASRRLGMRPVSHELLWWLAVEGACWQRPTGPGSSVMELLDHPVVHVSWYDAIAYCQWRGVSLPTEAQWEYAARAGHVQRRFPWGDALMPHGRVMCHTWQGDFPAHPAPGWAPGTLPVRSFEPNDWGLYDMVGHVWEWCADTFSSYYHFRTSDVDPLMTGHGAKKSMRGGSFLCHDSYCNRYRLAARGSNSAQSSSSNVGFRVVSSQVRADQLSAVVS